METNNSESYFCYICLSEFTSNDTNANPYKLSCGHIFCRECLHGFLKSNILEGITAPKCFKFVKNKVIRNNRSNSHDSKTEVYVQTDHLHGFKNKENQDFKDNDDPSLEDEPLSFETCGIEFCEEDINNIITGDDELIGKYKRFKYLHDNKNACECPKCNELLLMSSGDPNVICTM